MNEEERRERLISWLERIAADIRDLLLDDHIFTELQKIVATNPNFEGRSGLFTQWMASGYAQATAVGIRRQAKTRDSISLKRVLEEVKNHPALVSRAHYLGLFADRSSHLRKLAEKDFGEIADASGAHVEPGLVQKHIEEFAAAVGTIEHYVDRRVAHYDPRGLVEPVPTFADLTAALRKLEEIVLFYRLFLYGESTAELCPQPQFDWQDIFGFAWVPHEESPGETDE